MSIFKKEGTRKIVILIGILSIIFSLMFLYISIAEYNKINKIVNNHIQGIVNELIEKYPNIDEEEIIRIVNGNIELKDVDENVFDKYGYSKDNSYLNEIKKNKTSFLLINIIFILFFGLCSCLVYIMFTKRNDKKIKQINEYLTAINNGEYLLNIKDNGEDSISKLRNELYKTTILLKETAQNSENEKIQLQNSLEDISHQLKTPLTSIQIMIDNINENPDMDEETKSDFIREISKQIDWINSLVITLLKLAKLDAGATKLNKETINVKDLINNVIDNLSILLDIKNIEIISEIPDNTFFNADYKWELEALTNIVKNSIEHSNENSKIYIKIEDSSLFLKIRIIDEGQGIDKNDLKYIFKRFYKSKTSSDTSIGIGLSLAKTIIEKDNGYIKVDSQINKGSIFEIKYMK